jgi:uncharacterized protein YjbI with pentapeptide repeats
MMSSPVDFVLQNKFCFFVVCTTTNGVMIPYKNNAPKKMPHSTWMNPSQLQFWKEVNDNSSPTKQESETEVEISNDMDMSNNCKLENNEDDGYDEWISLKLDGAIFTTTRSTLLSDKQSLLFIMFHNNTPWKVPRDTSSPGKPYLLDRNPKYFAPILNFLRTGEIILDDGVNVKGVFTEAKYFNVAGLVEQLEPIVQRVEEEEQRSLEPGPELTRRDVVKALIKCNDSHGETTNGRLRFQGLNLSGLDLSGLDLSQINFSRCNLRRAKFCYANLDYADLRWCDLTDADCSFAHMCKVKCRNSKMVNIQLVNADLRGADLTFCDLSTSTFKNSDLGDADLSNSLLRNSDLSGANMKGVKLKNSTLAGCTHTNSMGGVIAK